MTRLFPEHIDWHGSLGRYTAAKLRIADLLSGRTLLINGMDSNLLEATDGIAGRVVGNRPPRIHRRDDELVLDGRSLVAAGATPLIGRHNLDNAALAMDAGILLGEAPSDLAHELKGFQPLLHRLETVDDIAGMRWINDSIATSPHATLAALQALNPAEVILIAGGQNRPAEWHVVMERLSKTGLLALVTLPDNGPHIQAAFRDRGVEPLAGMHSAETMQKAVTIAARLARPGAVVLLSPGAPSFPHYRDFEQRGKRFAEAVKSLEKAG